MTDVALRDCLAPAKLNLFLHITGRRTDGYHTLQTVFQLVDWGDTLHFTRRDDGIVARRTEVAGVAPDMDLTVRAARLLQAHTGCRWGVDIEIEKRMPMGAGLGGGSSDAATTLLALNRLWDLQVSRVTLQELAVTLGADVPFFVFGQTAFAEGIGEQLLPVSTPDRTYLIVTPPCHVATPAIFAAKGLTRDTKPITITDFLGASNRFQFGRNDMQPVVEVLYPEVAEVVRWLSQRQWAPDTTRMSGSGASVYAVFSNVEHALAAQAALPAALKWKSVVARGLSRHPLYEMGA